VAKRSPILGYNHNVKYRGIVFHVQTEDSGLLSPHLFTHLFHEGVIVSTRKLVYDPGANEEAIKALMQAQHKAVMKDLRRGAFDEKIDQYLGGVPGLEPSANGSAVPASGRGERAPTEATPPPPELIDPADATVPTDVPLDVPIETLPAGDESVPIELTVPKPRTRTARKSAAPPNKEPPAPMDDAPTVSDPSGSIAAAVAAANTSTARTAPPVPRGSAQPPVLRAATPPPIPARDVPELDADEMELEDDDNRGRLPRDTAVESVTIPPRSRTGDAVPKREGEASASAGTRRSPTGERPASHGAAALPPMKQPSRPSITPPTVMSRSLNDGRIHKPNDDAVSDAVEVYAPAPPSAEPPPGERSTRGGTYSMGRARPPSDNVPLREKTGRIAAINPNMIPQRDRPAPAPPPARPTAPSAPPVAHARPSTASREPSRPMEAMRPLAKPETPPAGVPQRVTPAVTTPMRATPQSGGNVVMTRPAVIVGAPAKAPTAPPQKVRKAREEEGRGFGQGLISEKSLDEVILAYLSEDAEEK
jgi:hypothetical protein